MAKPAGSVEKTVQKTYCFSGKMPDMVEMNLLITIEEYNLSMTSHSLLRYYPWSYL